MKAEFFPSERRGVLAFKYMGFFKRGISYRIVPHFFWEGESVLHVAGCVSVWDIVSGVKEADETRAH